MIQKLRLKFVAICMALVTAVMAVVFLCVYLSAFQNIEDISRNVLHRVINENSDREYAVPSSPSQNDGESAKIRPVPGVILGEDGVLLPFFTVSVWPSADGGAYTAYVTSGTYANLEDTEELAAILTDCLNQNEPEGTVSSYSLRFLRQDNGLFIKLAFVDMSMEQATLQELMGSYLQIGLAALALLLGVSILLSRWAVSPVEKAWRQQRQFLSDASHELKTPLTVILSNAELLEAAALPQRPARWADNIFSESKQMKKLVEEMLTLARADDMARTAVMTEVSLSDLATGCALAFEPVAFEAGKPLAYQIDPEVSVPGDGDKLRQVISSLLDNAVKYGQSGGQITLTLQKTDRLARLTVSNPGEPIPAEQLERLFERFYRADASRGEQSGFGLGLSIAAAIAAEHRGTLRAESDPESTRFILTLPLKK